MADPYNASYHRWEDDEEFLVPDNKLVVKHPPYSPTKSVRLSYVSKTKENAFLEEI